MLKKMHSNSKNTHKTFSKTQVKELKQFYVDKYLYAVDLFQHIPRQTSKEGEDDPDEGEPSISLHELPPRLCPAVKNEKAPAKTVEELLDRLGKLRGLPKLGYKDKLLKKNLKNKLLKKGRKERQKQNKSLNNTSPGQKEKIQKKQKPVLNSEGQVIYSKFDFSVLGAKKSDFKKSHKDPEVLLKKIKESEKKIKSMKEEGQVEKVKDIVEKKAVRTALMRCEGIKVKDDTELLKKSIKRKKLKKEKSAKKWEAREKQLKKEQEERQLKRKRNIQARAHQKKLGKLKKAAKKGRLIPGF